MKSGIVIALLFVGQGAFAQGKPAAEPAKGGAAMEAPKPSEELTANIKFWGGKWTCTGKAAAGPMGPAHGYTSKLEFKPELGGFWMRAVIDEPKTKDNPMPMSLQVMAGWDPIKKMLARVDYYAGGGWMMFTSTGWQGDKEVFNGDGQMMGKPMKMTHTATKKGDSEVTNVFEGPGPDGKMMTMFDETCKKAGAKK